MRPPKPEKLLRKQLKAFRKRSARDPFHNEPVFFDPDAPGDVAKELTITRIRSEIVNSMAQAGVPPEFAYAVAKTGYIIVDGFEDNFSAEAKAEWCAAIEEYFK